MSSYEQRQARRAHSSWKRNHPGRASIEDIGTAARTARKVAPWAVAAVVVVLLYQGMEGGIRGDDSPESDDRPVADAPKDPEAEKPKDEPKDNPAKPQGSPGDIDSLYAFLVGDGNYPSHISTVEIPIPPNGPDEVATAIEQAQATNRKLLPGYDPSKIDAVTACTGAIIWRRGSDWGTAEEQLKAGRFDEANVTCVGIAREVAGNAPPSGTSYISVPELEPRG